MMGTIRFRAVLTTGAMIALSSFGVGLPATDADGGNELAETSVGAVVVAVVPEVFEDLASDVSVSDSEARVEVVAVDPMTQQEVVEGSATLHAEEAAIELTGLVGDTFAAEILTEGDDAATITDDGALVVEVSPGVQVLVVVKEDASVQIVASIESSDASERIPLDLGDGEAVDIVLDDDGLATVSDAQGAFLGFVAPPWAFDAEGRSVPTHFEVDGTMLVQIVDHTAGDFTYPIVADPYLGKNLFQGFTYSVTLRKHSFSKSAFGQSIHRPTNYGIFLNQGWAEFQARNLGPSRVNTSVRQQYDCHAAGGYFDLAGITWDLEYERPARTFGNWFFGSAIHRCNWNTPNRY